MAEQKHTTLRLSERELRRAKMEALKHGKTLQELLRRGLELALIELRKPKEAA